jgi:hypothetical protein
VDDNVDAEVGVSPSPCETSLRNEEPCIGWLLSSPIQDFEGLSNTGAAEAGASSYALLNVFRTVGDMADSVSSRRLEPLPNVLTLVVLRCSFGRLEGGGIMGGCWTVEGECIGEDGNIVREAAMVVGVICSCGCDCVPEDDGMGGGGLDIAIIMWLRC